MTLLTLVIYMFPPFLACLLTIDIRAGKGFRMTSILCEVVGLFSVGSLVILAIGVWAKS
jgi:hypothetical protein